MSYGGMTECGTGSLKYRPRLGYYKISTGNCTLWADKKRNQYSAYSYGHWQFVAVIKGLLVFNDYSYSNTTSGHQSEVRRVLKQLRRKIDLVVYSQSPITRPEHLKEHLEELYKSYYEAKAHNELRKRVHRELPLETKQLRLLEKKGFKLSKAKHRELQYQAEYAEVVREFELQANRAKPGQGTSNPLKQAKDDLLESSFVNI